MDEQIDAKCECGFDSWPFYVAGFFTGERTPAVCKPCGQFFYFNYLEGQKYCSYCKKEVEFYMLDHIKDAWDPEAGPEMIPFDEEQKYYCPECGMNELKFQEIRYRGDD